MTWERPSVMPIATSPSATTISRESQPAQSCPEITTAKIHMNKTSPSLPSPPLSPHSDHGARLNSLPMLPLATTPSPAPSCSTTNDDSSLISPSAETFSHHSLDSFGLLEKSNSSSSSCTSTSSLTSAETPFPVGDPSVEEIDETVPMLPSQLRRRHESMKLLAKKQQPVIFELGDERQEIRSQDQTNLIIELDSQELPDDKIETDETEVINASYHSGAMIRAKSYSMFESSNFDHTPSHPWGPSQQMEYLNGEMPTKDWVMIQSKMQALELEISHIRRTNMLLNQELDKVNAHLSRVTSNSEDDEDGQGAGWRREYEFMVQQVDWMHQQLQLAHAEKQGRSQYQAEMTRELCAEVKGLTASLRMWQSAFQEAEEKYRRKCEGERVLKQTLREREGQLSSLVEKLTGCESEFQKSLSNYEELVRLSAELELIEGSTNKSSVPKQLALNDSLTREGISDMPGTFPGQQWHCESKSEIALVPATDTTTDQLTVSILSWATLLATYMLS
ncbi:hypothetical protein BGZ79_006457 [Entomortierella chlamydospora]|nr:hypothetical protein BGZ79_006457 [Entomortierella chlamydospora]